MTQHAPTPWILDKEPIGYCGEPFTIGGVDPSDGLEYTIASIWSEKQNHTEQTPLALANAAVIVKAVNSHDALVDAVKSLIEANNQLIIKNRSEPQESCDAKIKAEAALKLARGES